MDAIEKAGRAFCEVVVAAIHDKVRSRGGSASLSGSEYYMYPPAIEAFDKAIEAAILSERQRCADVALKWATDDIQAGETRLAARYIHREITNP